METEGHVAPKFYGATTVGERGQVVIPAEARRDFGIKPTDKLVVFGSRHHGGIVITKADSFSKFLDKSIGMMIRFGEMVKGETKIQAED
jgi:AbrB family looped-hinge helix DNA binding protein